MRKTKLIILPTKCLNQMGFLLLFLSCPVIGDWGRIRPDSEMSQWSIRIEREGSCGLVRDSPGIKDVITPDGLMECNAADAMIRNNTQSLTKTSQVPKTAFITRPEFPVIETGMQRAAHGISSRVQTGRRVNNARQESFRRSSQARNIQTERRALSLDRQTSSKYDERRSDRMQREVKLERNNRERNDYRRITRSLDRKVDEKRVLLERRIRDSNERDLNESARRMLATRRDREVNERRVNSETARRRVENGRRIQETREIHKRNEHRAEEQRLTRRALQDERDVRSDRERRSMARRVRESRHEPERRNLQERRMERRENREDRMRNVYRTEELSPERRIRASNNRERDIRTARRNDMGRDAAESRREESEGNVRSLIRSEAVRDRKGIENELSRRQDIRASVRRMDKPQDRRDFQIDGMREKSARFDYRIGYDKLEPLNVKNGRWEFLNGIKTFLGEKTNQEDWASKHGDFAMTCLLGAAVYYLTTRQAKSV